MNAIDTNIVVRVLTRDDPRQAQRARQIVEGGEVFVATSVILETEWVLRSVYEHSSSEALSAIIAFVSLPTVKLERPDVISKALEWAAQGVDFADALHLAGANGCAAFVTFDRGLIKTGARLDSVEVRAP